METPGRLQPTPRRRILTAVVFFGVLGCAGAALFGGLLAWKSAGARAFVRGHFAAVRRGQAGAVPSAASPEVRDAYRAVAASTEETLPRFPDYHGFGLPHVAFNTESCFDGQIVTRGQARDVSIVIRGHTEGGGKETFEVVDISLRRRCDCSDDRPGHGDGMWNCDLQ
jgi:hypothetical protein